MEVSRYPHGQEKVGRQKGMEREGQQGMCMHVWGKWGAAAEEEAFLQDLLMGVSL